MAEEIDQGSLDPGHPVREERARLGLICSDFRQTISSKHRAHAHSYLLLMRVDIYENICLNICVLGIGIIHTGYNPMQQAEYE